MIKVKHPDEACNQEQEKLLKSCPESVRRYHELLFTYGNITYNYHQQAKAHLTEELWLEWLDGLPELIKEDMKMRGYETAKNVVSFNRYVMERLDKGLQEYVERHMDKADYVEYQKLTT